MRRTPADDSPQEFDHRSDGSDAVEAAVSSEIKATRAAVARVTMDAAESTTRRDVGEAPTVALLAAGRFYAARARYERRGDPVPANLFRRVGRRLIEQGRIAEGCAAFQAVDATVPRRALIKAGDAFFAEYDLDTAVRAYEEAGAPRKLANVADVLMRNGRFFAARSVYERVGMPVPVERFRQAAKRCRAAGDALAAAAACAAVGIDLPEKRITTR